MLDLLSAADLKSGYKPAMALALATRSPSHDDDQPPCNQRIG